MKRKEIMMSLTLLGISAAIFAYMAVMIWVADTAAKNEQINKPVSNVASTSVLSSDINATSSIVEIKKHEPYLRVKFLTPTVEHPVFKRTADVFVVSGGLVVGEDSRSGRKVGTDAAKYELDSEGVLEIEFEDFGEYTSNVKLVVVGLVEGTYDLSGIFFDEKGSTHEFLFSTSTDEMVMDTYTFSLSNGESLVRRVDYAHLRSALPTFEDDNGLCDKEDLQRQLITLLSNRGWSKEAVPLVNAEVGFIDKFSGLYELPFGTEKVCAVKMRFKEEFIAQVPFEQKAKPFVGLFSTNPQSVIVGGKTYGHNPADGPLSSSDTIPITQSGNELQLLQVTEANYLIPVNFPDFSVCPCGAIYKALFTAPMYP